MRLERILDRIFWMDLIPIFVFLGFIGFGLALNRVLPASTGPYLPKRWLFGLIAAIFLVACLLMVVYVIVTE